MKSFDAVQTKNKKSFVQSRSDKKAGKQIQKINKIYPVIGVTKEGYIRTKIGLYEGVMDIIGLRKYDLNLLDEDGFQFVTENHWRFLKQYPFPIKEVYMNFQEENREQQEYLLHKIEKCTSSTRLRVLHQELEKLKHIEAHYEMKEVYLFVFAAHEEELKKRLELLKQYRSYLGAYPMSIEKKEKILFKLNNYKTK